MTIGQWIALAVIGLLMAAPWVFIAIVCSPRPCDEEEEPD